MAKANDRLRLFDAQVKAIIDPLLAEHGFARAGRARLWVGPSSTGKGICQLVWLQVGESASLRDGKYTVELGVYYPKYDRFCNKPELAGPVIGACHFDVRSRLGLLMSPPADHWWPYAGTEKSVAERLGETGRLLTELGLPWLQTTDTPENAALYNTGKMPEPDRKRREAFERHRGRS